MPCRHRPIARDLATLGTVAGVRQKNSTEMERNQTEHKNGTEGSDSREFVRCNILLTLLSDNNVVTFVRIEVETYYVWKNGIHDSLQPIHLCHFTYRKNKWYRLKSIK